MAKKTSKHVQTDSNQFTLATPSSLRALAELLKKFACELESIAEQLSKNKPAAIEIRGRTGVDSFIKRLDGYVHNARQATIESQPGLKIGEPLASYHAEKNLEK